MLKLSKSARKANPAITCCCISLYFYKDLKPAYVRMNPRKLTLATSFQLRLGGGTHGAHLDLAQLQRGARFGRPLGRASRGNGLIQVPEIERAEVFPSKKLGLTFSELSERSLSFLDVSLIEALRYVFVGYFVDIVFKVYSGAD